MRARGRLRAAALVALVPAVLALAGGCGEGDEAAGDATAEVEGVGVVRGGSTAQFASCGDWRRGTKEERYATLEDIRGQLTPQSSETAESDLSDDRAYEIFQHTCAPEWAASLRLYKLYARAQVFAPLADEE